MVLETGFMIAKLLLGLNPVILIGLVLGVAYVGYKVFAFAFRIILTGIAFGLFPVIANLVGIPVPLTIESIMWSAIVGIVLLFVYTGIKFGYKIVNLALLPFKKTFKKSGKKGKAKELKEEVRR